MQRAQQLKRNITVLYGVEAIGSFLLIMPVIVPFYEANGLNQTQLFLIQSIFATTILLLEVPSGYFADRFGRKLCIQVGGLLGALGLVVYSMASGFWGIAAANIFLGVAVSWLSGADSAMAYDSLHELNQTDGYRQYESRSLAITGLSEASAGVIGGLLALISLRTPVVVHAIIACALLPCVLWLVEPARLKRVVERNPFLDVLHITKYALRDHLEVKWLILYAAVLGTMTYTMVWLTQPFYAAVGIPLAWYGVLWAAQLLSLAVFTRFCDSFEKRFGVSHGLLVLLGVGVGCYVVLALFQTLWALVFVWGFYFVRALNSILMKDYINAAIDSDMRATILSVKNMAQKVFYIAIGPVIGVVTDTVSLRAALFFSAMVYGVLGGLAWWRMRVLKVGV